MHKTMCLDGSNNNTPSGSTPDKRVTGTRAFSTIFKNRFWR